MSQPQESTPPPASDLANAQYATLLDRPSSDLAVSLCATLLAGVLHNQQTKKPRKKQLDAFGGLIADVLQRDPQDHGGWLYRSMRPAGFTGDAIGYKVFRPIFKAMEGQMIESDTGRQFMTRTELTGGTWQVANQQATRFRANEWLRRWFGDQGITRENWGDHFQRDPVAVRKAQGKPKDHLILRGGKPPRSTGLTKRPSLPINRKDPAVPPLITRMEKLNAFLADQVVEPFGPTVHLKRIFSEGQLPDHGWKHGGRLYALGKSSYQNAKKEARRTIRLNDKPTVELDLRASHLSILVGLGHLPLSCLEGDPYVIEGLPREVVKQFATMTISHGKRHRSWPKKASEELMEKHGLDVKSSYPLKSTGDAILAKLPLIGGDGLSVPVGWGELQFRESEIILSAMETLAYEHGAASLPVHDSLIVPEVAEVLAREALQEAFRSSLGVVPVVEARD